jgi:mannose-6-phosphate isomerase-like protein (cupin superfamily)
MLKKLLSHSDKKYFVGSIKDCQKAEGWFFGQFMDEPLLQSKKVEIAWQDISHKKTDKRDCHFHKNSVEINIVISGKVSLKIDGNYVRVYKNQFYVIYPYTVIENIEAGDNTQLIVVRTPSKKADKFTPVMI